MSCELRPLDDLISEIEIDGEKFIPMHRIAALCFNYNVDTVKNEAKMFINDGYDYNLWYSFETNILLPKKHTCYISVSRTYDIRIYHEIDGIKSDTADSHSNQVKVIKYLRNWGFIEL